MNGQHGQSLVEFAVGSTALLLLLLGVITLSGYQEVQRRGIAAARQAAFESTWRSTNSDGAAVAHGVYLHHFDDAGILDSVGRARYVAKQDVYVTHDIGPSPGLAGEATTLLLAPLQIATDLVGGEFDLQAGGYVAGEVVVRLPPNVWLPQPFRDLDLSLQQAFAILSDPWSASGAIHVEERTAALVPAQRLGGLAASWGALAAPMRLLEPSIDKLCLGIIEPDLIPEDRLGPVMEASRSRRPCQ